MTDLTSSASCGVGFICSVQGTESHTIVSQGIEAVKNLTHRGAMGADGKSGDGAGILIRLPHEFFRAELARLDAPDLGPGELGVGALFLSGADEKRIAEVLVPFGLGVIGWREVPVNDAALGAAALSTRPLIRHLLLDLRGIAPPGREPLLYLARRALERTFGTTLYVCSLSSRILVYKGMLVANYLDEFYPDLLREDLASPFCLFHQRFSTNTSPDWSLTQPFRALAHNGEINTLQGNRNALAALEREVMHAAFHGRDDLLRPLTDPGESDSASLDRIVELLVLAGRSPEHAALMCIPPAWEGSDLPPAVQAFFDYHSLLMRPWDGPAAVVFTDGMTVGAHLDRNGLRPLRYTLTGDGLLVVGSEIGMIDLGSRPILEKGRLGPGEILSVDLASGRVRMTEEIVAGLAAEKPYAVWLAKRRPRLAAEREDVQPREEIARGQAAFGYSREELRMRIGPMAASGKEVVFSMGDDTPLPMLTDRPRLLFDYFRQRFSQVTNPPIDPIRERLVMSLTLNLGRKRNFLAAEPEHAERLALPSPILSGSDLTAIELQKAIPWSGIAITYAPARHGLVQALELLEAAVVNAVLAGSELLILSDRDVSPDRAAMPSLLAVAAAVQTLQAKGLAARASIIVETGEARDAHQLACLIGYGASAVHPWLLFETVAGLCGPDGLALPVREACQNCTTALEDGLLKIMARMGISTLGSYHGARLFDAVCLDRDVVDRYFPGTNVRFTGHGIRHIESALLARHRAGFGSDEPLLDEGGQLKYRKDGEYHAWSPQIVQALNRFMKDGDPEQYRTFSRLADSHPVSLHQVLDIRPRAALPLEAVEPEELILKRFFSGAMSVGALSPEAHETIAEACNRLGIKSNSGEGGEDPARYFTTRGSAIKQIASGRFGVTPAYLASAADLEIKMAQGAKPGEGGHLPGDKVTDYIARLRHCKPGMTLISPPPHHDIYSIEDLAQLVHDLKQANPRAHVCVKLVAEAGVGTIAAGVAKAYADIVQISGAEGGTGAAPVTSIKHAGGPWEPALVETVRALQQNGLRDRIRVRVDGGLRTGRDVVIAALLGAEEFGFGTATMITTGCVMARQCHLNTCPTGVATQDPELRKRFRGTVDGVIAYFRALAREVREILASMGAGSLVEIIGRTDLLAVRKGFETLAADLAPLLVNPGSGPRTCMVERNDGPAGALNERLARKLGEAIAAGRPVAAEYAIRNVDRTIPARLSYLIAKQYGDQGLPDDTLQLRFVGTAGQSFGAFNHNGLSLTLLGDANDYAGKGMFGGRISIIPADLSDEPHRHVIVGNTVLYGATGGEFYAAGIAGERFAVRNSGARAVIEGAGLHLCEYMTRGVVVVLGEVGRNVGAGMTGGTIYILDGEGKLPERVNRSSVKIEEVERDEDIAELEGLLVAHFRHTGSMRADDIMSDLNHMLPFFRKVVPK